MVEEIIATASCYFRVDDLVDWDPWAIHIWWLKYLRLGVNELILLEQTGKLLIGTCSLLLAVKSVILLHLGGWTENIRELLQFRILRHQSLLDSPSILRVRSCDVPMRNHLPPLVVSLHLRWPRCCWTGWLEWVASTLAQVFPMMLTTAMGGLLMWGSALMLITDSKLWNIVLIN